MAKSKPEGQEEKHRVSLKVAFTKENLKANILLLLACLVAGAIIGAVISSFAGFGAKETGGRIVLSKSEVGNKTLTVVKNIQEQQGSGIQTSLLDIGEYGNNLYIVNLSMTLGTQTQLVSVYVTKDGKLIPQSQSAFAIDIVEGAKNTSQATPTVTFTPTATPTPQTNVTTPSSIKTFQTVNGSVCKEDGKPIIRLFSTTWCPHCKWIKSTYDSVVSEYVNSGKIVAYHWEVDTGDNTLTSATETSVPESELQVYQTFNPKGSIPTFVFGCKYYRVGNGYEQEGNLTAEEAEFRAVIETLLA